MPQYAKIEPNYWSIPTDRVCLIRALSVTNEYGFTEIYFKRLPIIKYTACGAWVTDCGEERFVNLKGEKKFACVTETEALMHLKYRKRRQLQIVEFQVTEAKNTLSLIERGLLKEPNHQTHWFLKPEELGGII